MEKKNLYCVIMAGGAGSRFWPYSRDSKPKQFLDILSTGRTLLQMTFDRFRKLFPNEQIFIVTSANYKKLTLEQLPEISEKQVLLEPMRRNTAPCIAYANYRIQKLNPEAVIVVSPADHLIVHENEFIQTINQAINFAASKDVLVTLGIKPSSPQTGYGYIQINPKEIDSENMPNLRMVKTFTEKPDLEMAKVFYESGEFYWNSGIFIWSLKSIMNSFRQNLPEVNSLFADKMDVFNTKLEQKSVEKIYADCKNISIDYGIMEKAENVYVFCSDFGWSDLGTWGSLYENSPHDENGNALNSKNILTYKTKNCIVKVQDNKLAVLQGLNDYIVVETDNVLLVCKSDQEQQIRQFVNDVKIEKGEKYI
jgi:mannose-1-phosphate guanylyltransferase